MPDYSAGGLLADQAVLPLNIHHGSASASMSHADAAAETHTATRTASSLSLNPQDETGSANSQSPLLEADSARNVAICTESEMEDSATARDVRIPGLSQKDCLRERGSDAGREPKFVCQVLR